MTYRRSRIYLIVWSFQYVYLLHVNPQHSSHCAIISHLLNATYRTSCLNTKPVKDRVIIDRKLLWASRELLDPFFQLPRAINFQSIRWSNELQLSIRNDRIFKSPLPNYIHSVLKNSSLTFPKFKPPIRKSYSPAINHLKKEHRNFSFFCSFQNSQTSARRKKKIEKQQTNRKGTRRRRLRDQSPNKSESASLGRWVGGYRFSEQASRQAYELELGSRVRCNSQAGRQAGKQADKQAGRQAGKASRQVQHWCCLRTETAVVLPCPTAGARANRISTFPLRCVTFLLSFSLLRRGSFHVRSLLIGICLCSCNGQRSSRSFPAHMKMSPGNRPMAWFPCVRDTRTQRDTVSLHLSHDEGKIDADP